MPLVFFPDRWKAFVRRRTRGVTNHPLFPAALLAGLVFTCVCTLWQGGLFQFFELQLYDRLLRSRPKSTPAASKVVIVGITEEDIQREATYPIPDDVLHRALKKLMEAAPATVVVDLYRDLPVPGKDPEGSADLAEFWMAHPNVLAIQRLGMGDRPGVRAPRFLKDSPDQVGFNDFSVDYKVDETARRALLIMDDSDKQYYAVAFLAAQLYLQGLGIELEQDQRNGQHFRLGKAKLSPFEPNDGPYVQADARGFQMLLDFRGPEKFPTYSLTDMLTEKIPAEILRGNVVFIGPLASSLKDHLITPLAKRFPGVLLHAHVVNQLLRQSVEGQRPLRFWSEKREAFWLLLWCGAGTLVGLKVKSPLAFIVALGTCVGGLFAAYRFAFAADFWLPLVAPSMGCTTAAVLGTSYQAYLEMRNRSLLMQLFSRHVSTSVAADIWQRREQFLEGRRPKAQVITATVMFTDLAGFTAKAETLSPDKLLEWLNEYMEVMSGLVEQHGGMVNKYMGDAIMAVFGAPIPRTHEAEHRDDAANAVRCALAMGPALDQLNTYWTERGSLTTSMRVGIATGQLISGSIGSSERLEYTVTGDTVVIAKRLESAGKDAPTSENVSRSCQILIAETTRNMLRSLFKVREIGPMQLQGRHQMVRVFAVAGAEEGGGI